MLLLLSNSHYLSLYTFPVNKLGKFAIHLWEFEVAYKSPYLKLINLLYIDVARRCTIGAGLHITSKSLTNVSKIFHWRVTDANYLPAGDYIKHSWYFSKTLNTYNLSVKYDVICSTKLDFLTIFVTDLLLIDPVLSKSTWFDKCKWHLAWVVVAILREAITLSSGSQNSQNKEDQVQDNAKKWK